MRRSGKNRLRFASSAVLAPLAFGLSGCSSVNTHREVEPIKITMDVNVKMDRALADAFEAIDKESRELAAQLWENGKGGRNEPLPLVLFRWSRPLDRRAGERRFGRSDRRTDGGTSSGHHETQGSGGCGRDKRRALERAIRAVAERGRMARARKRGSPGVVFPFGAPERIRREQASDPAGPADPGKSARRRLAARRRRRLVRKGKQVAGIAEARPSGRRLSALGQGRGRRRSTGSETWRPSAAGACDAA